MSSSHESRGPVCGFESLRLAGLFDSIKRGLASKEEDPITDCGARVENSGKFILCEPVEFGAGFNHGTNTRRAKNEDFVVACDGGAKILTLSHAFFPLLCSCLEIGADRDPVGAYEVDIVAIADRSGSVRSGSLNGP